jgi:hypothetical protein
MNFRSVLKKNCKGVELFLFLCAHMFFLIVTKYILLQITRCRTIVHKDFIQRVLYFFIEDQGFLAVITDYRRKSNTYN